MSKTDKETWDSLLAMSAPTFAGEGTPPFGFMTSTVASLRMQESQVAEFERIGWRALLASLAALAITATVAVTVSSRSHSSGDFDPGVKSLVQMESISIS